MRWVIERRLASVDVEAAVREQMEREHLPSNMLYGLAIVLSKEWGLSRYQTNAQVILRSREWAFRNMHHLLRTDRIRSPEP